MRAASRLRDEEHTMSVGQVGKRVLKGFGVLFAISLAISIFRHANEDPKERAALDAARIAAVDKKAKDYVAIDQAEKGLKSILKDADSAKFRDVTVAQWIENKPVVCGYVNSKNSFGGYTGDTEFAVFNGLVSINDHNHKEFATLWNTLCLSNPNLPEKAQP